MVIAGLVTIATLVTIPVIVISSQKVPPTTLAGICGLEALNAEPSTLNLYPPSRGVDSDYWDADQNIVGLVPSGVNLQNIHPVGFPQYFGLCNAAKDSWGTFTTTCGALTSIADPDAARYCGLVDSYAKSFSIVLQLEYIASRNDLRSNGDFGSAYAESLLTSGSNVAGVSGIIGDVAADMAEMSTITQASAVPDRLKGMGQVFNTIGGTGFKGHASGLRANVYPTTALSSSSLHSLHMVPYSTNLRSAIAITGTYPKNFDLCKASQNFFDAMLQNPKQRYPQLSPSLDVAFRCNERGARLLDIQSRILGWEWSTATNATTCPSKQTLTDLVDEFSSTLSKSSEFYFGFSQLIAPVVYSAPPTTSSTFWLPGNDVFVLQYYWVTFVKVHIPLVERQCGYSITFNDLMGIGGEKELFTSSDYTYFGNILDKLQYYIEDSSGMFPEAPTYRKYTPNGALSSPFTAYDGSVAQPLNAQAIPALENAASMTAYTYERRAKEFESVYGDNMVRIGDAYKACDVYDPIGYFQNFIALPVPVDEGLARAIVQIVSNLPKPYTNSPAKCTGDVSTTDLDCIRHVCGMPLSHTLNPDVRFVPLFGSYVVTQEVTVGHAMAPLCILANHTPTIARCAAWVYATEYSATVRTRH